MSSVQHFIGSMVEPRMNRNFLFRIVAVAVLWWPHAAFGAAGPVIGYERKNDVFSVPLSVRDNSGVDRRAWPVTAGVPLPAGVVRDVKGLRLIDAR